MHEVELEADIVLFEDLTFTIHKNTPSITFKGGVDVATYDLVYVKNWRAHQGAASALACYLKGKKTKLVCSELNVFRAMDKITEAFLLTTNGIPYPDTVFTVHSKDIIEAIKSDSGFSFPLVMKAIDGSAGEDNYLVHSDVQLMEIITKHPDVQFMVQTLIENDGDHRIILMGFAPKLSFKRTRTDDTTHLNNTSQGASAVLTNLKTYSDAVIEDCVKAARLVQREIAGADVLFDKVTGEHVILEVNASPQLATGAFVKEKKHLFQEYIKSKVEAE